eukprot:6415188-Prymnesium_polylepis.5
MASPQAGAFEEFSRYAGDDDPTMMSQGPIMCILALLVWLTVCTKESKAIISYFRAIVALRRNAPGRKGEPKQRQFFEIAGPGKVKIHAMGHGRAVFQLLVLAVRVVILVSLSATGCVYLAHTVSITELILNTVALEMIISLDEFIFLALVPERIIRVVVSRWSHPCASWPAIWRWRRHLLCRARHVCDCAVCAVDRRHGCCTVRRITRNQSVLAGRIQTAFGLVCSWGTSFTSWP